MVRGRDKASSSRSRTDEDSHLAAWLQAEADAADPPTPGLARANPNSNSNPSRAARKGGARSARGSPFGGLGGTSALGATPPSTASFSAAERAQFRLRDEGEGSGGGGGGGGGGAPVSARRGLPSGGASASEEGEMLLRGAFPGVAPEVVSLALRVSLAALCSGELAG